MTTDYDINLDDKYGRLAVIDIAAEAKRTVIVMVEPAAVVPTRD
jgi:hypothetical protein